MDENKVKYGLKNVHYAIATISSDLKADFGTPKPWPGAVSLSLNPMGDSTAFYADDTVFFFAPPASGYQGDLEIANVPEDVFESIFKDAVDQNGVTYEADGTEVAHIALLFEFSGDKKAVRHVLYNCTLTRPAIEGETRNEKNEPKPTKISISASTIYVEALDKYIVKANTRTATSAQVYQDWYKDVYIPTGTNVPTGE